MQDPLEVTLTMRLTPLRDDPVTREQVVTELQRNLEELDIRVPFNGPDLESAFTIEVVCENF
jgi:hypothetical protein